MVLFNGQTALCGENGITFNPVLTFSSDGILASMALHERSHSLVAGLTNTDMDWECDNYNKPIAFTENASSDTKGFAINSAGLIGQENGSEVIFQVDKIDKNRSYASGMMLWNALNPILYALDSWFLGIANKKEGNKYQGSTQGIERYSNGSVANEFALSIAAIAAFQGYRFLQTQSWASDWIKKATHNINFVPTPVGSILMTYKLIF
jgi:hypothetical protein